ncbi:MAG TPA: cellobiose phosphorylase [Anaerolineae bacterium]|nr:cellobiose phosphorylase [Anaerolineae bacterium]
MCKGNWQFVDDKGTFVLPDPDRHSYLYFPLVNEGGLVAVVTPTLHGDVKAGQNRFLTLPVSAEDLHMSRAARNFWVNVVGYGAWSATGNSARQIAQRFVAEDGEQVEMQAGFLWHRVTRSNPALGLQAEITNFVPSGGDLPVETSLVELMRVVLTNVGSESLTLTPTAAVPIFGRSADRVRDHRHVTSLLHRIYTHPYGVVVRPTLVFDERGHRPNTVAYAVLGAEGNGTPPVAFFPKLETFVGPAGSLDWPQAVAEPELAGFAAGQSLAGYEAMGALRFRRITLDPGQRWAYVLVLGILDEDTDLEAVMTRYGDQARFEAWMIQTKIHWEQKLASLQMDLGEARLNGWLKWVTVQPILRRICGNSFLPYHDYGRGGRGWRDLWQDQLALLLMEPGEVRDQLYSNFAGIRLDGSNATIIGDAPGEFRADRNNIPRVWMDHGAWPLLTTQLYLDRSGDLAFLLKEQVYFKDSWIHRAKAVDEAWNPEDGTELRTSTGSIYRGSILEHLLVQHLTAFFHVGEHNIIRLEGADWNDGLDMARQHGESVAFTAFYACNLQALSQLVMVLGRLGLKKVRLFAELLPLLDRLNTLVDYDSAAAKQSRLANYFAATQYTISGARVAVPLHDLSADLAAKADWLYAHLRRQEWLQQGEGLGWFNGYYDEEGQRLEGDHPEGVRMTLTGQVFALMGGVATDEQARQIVRAADRYLYDPSIGGYRLNTDFGRAGERLSMNLGRCFGFAFGHKENGAMFSHMAVMYANALYKRGLVPEGFAVLDSIYRHSQDLSRSGIYPGIPEYVEPGGRGMYPYLTGSASWYLLTMLTEVLGIKGRLGDLALEPKLMPEQFDADGWASVLTLFADRKLKVAYHNPDRLPWGMYTIAGIRLDGEEVSYERQGRAAILSQGTLMALTKERAHTVEASLATDTQD